MVRIFARRTSDVRYFTDDRALELEGVRENGPGWWWRGEGDVRDPAVVSRVLVTSDRSAIRGYDLVVAAPRATSILLAIDPLSSPGLIAAHRAAVEAAVTYLEERAVVVRETRRGVEFERSGVWESAVAFTHGLNRHGEPHLHDHVLVGARPRDSAGVLDSRALFAHAPSADALYRATLRHEVAQRTPWTSWRSFLGAEHVVGLDEGYRALWAGHHRDRGEKLSWGREETLASWRRDAERFVSIGEVDPPSTHRRHLDEHRFCGAMEGRMDVSRRHVIAAWSDAAVFGQGARSVVRDVDDLYPALRNGLGVHESVISVAEARMVGAVRELGPRPLQREELERWRYRSRDRERSREGRSR